MVAKILPNGVPNVVYLLCVGLVSSTVILWSHSPVGPPFLRPICRIANILTPVHTPAECDTLKHATNLCRVRRAQPCNNHRNHHNLFAQSSALKCITTPAMGDRCTYGDGQME